MVYGEVVCVYGVELYKLQWLGDQVHGEVQPSRHGSRKMHAGAMQKLLMLSMNETSCICTSVVHEEDWKRI
jgi:hypothetical protein